MGKTAKDVMNKAISYLNTKESPANSNNVIFNTDYYGKKVSGSAYPWCCAFVWDIFRLAGASSLFYDGKKTAYCPTVESWGKSNKLTVDKNKGKYGDIVLFDFYGKGVSCHIGLIVQKNSDGTYKTIEGNTAVGNDDNGGCVMYRTRSKSSIRCIIRPKYTSKSTTTTSSTTKKETKPTVAKPTIKNSSKGTQVKYLQQDLNYLGYKGADGKKLTVDGITGKNVVYAIKQFQKKYKLTVDGVYGDKSYTKMKALLK